MIFFWDNYYGFYMPSIKMIDVQILAFQPKKSNKIFSHFQGKIDFQLRKVGDSLKKKINKGI